MLVFQATFTYRKLPYIYWHAKWYRWYLESSHLFILTFCDEAVKVFGDKLHVIHLRRDPNEVASSFASLGWEPHTHPWMPDPRLSNHVLDLQLYKK